MTAPAAVGASLARRSMHGAAWSVVGYGAGQALRFANSLILTRMLAPEHFGLMALVNTLLIGVAMFSDVGIGPNVVQSKRGSDRVFLDTAWTLQVMRGVVGWLLCIAAAWPFAAIYNDPRLVPLVAASGFASVISGFTSTKILTAFRDINIRRVTLLELCAQALTVVATVAYASISPSVWALVFAALFSAGFKLCASHWWLQGANNRFSLDRDSMRELIRFGRWVFVSSMLAFVANSAANLILGRFLSVAELGVFALATMLANVVCLAYEQVASKVLFPLYARLLQEAPSELRARMRKARLGVAAVFVPPLVIMTVFGQQIIELLFDPRYRGGGWILQLFSAFAIPSVISASGPYYLAKGNSFLLMAWSAAKLVIYLLCVWVGWQIAGAHGIIVGIASHTALVYLMDLTVQRAYGIMMLKLDLSVVVLASAAIALGLRATGQWS